MMHFLTLFPYLESEGKIPRLLSMEFNVQQCLVDIIFPNVSDASEAKLTLVSPIGRES